jgi:hypothetical protein
MSAVRPDSEAPADTVGEPRGDSTVSRIVPENHLRDLREAAGLTPEQAGYEIRASALRRPLGCRAMMRAQMNRLVEVAKLPHATLQVVPSGRGRHAAARTGISPAGRSAPPHTGKRADQAPSVPDRLRRYQLGLARSSLGANWRP